MMNLTQENQLFSFLLVSFLLIRYLLGKNYDKFIMFSQIFIILLVSLLLLLVENIYSMILLNSFNVIFFLSPINRLTPSNPPINELNYYAVIYPSLLQSIYLNIFYNSSSEMCLLINDVAITNYEYYKYSLLFLSIDSNIFYMYY